jgi:ParB/RepB/Spo0J family partition protein
MAITEEIPIHRVYPNPNQPRTVFAEGPLQELANSISTCGLAQAIVVAPRSCDLGDYLIIMGERRWRASQLAGKATIPATIREDLDDDGIADLALAENLIRQDLNAIEEARAYRRMLDHQHTVESLTKMLGFKDETRVTERLALLNLDLEFQQAVLDGTLSAPQGRQMAYLSADGQRKVFHSLSSGQLPTMGKLRRMVVAIYDDENQQNLFKEDSQLTESEKRSLSQVDRFIEASGRLLSMLTDEDLQLVRMTHKSDGPLCIDQLGLLISVASRLKLSLETSQAKSEVNATARKEAA